MSKLSPKKIMDVGLGFFASRTLLAAIELDLFTKLGTDTMTAAQIRETLGLHERAVPDFTDALLSLGFLTREGDGPDAQYGNTEETGAFLNRNSPQFMGGLLAMAARRLYGFWDALPTALATGRPQNEVARGEDMFAAVYEQPDNLEEFMTAMVSLNTISHRSFAKMFDFGSYETVLDIGGGPAQLSCEIVLANPGVRCTSFDLWPVKQIAEKNIEKHGVADRVSCAVGNYITDELPKADVITMGMVLHNNDLEGKKKLIKKAYDALPEGGALVALDMLIDDARRERSEAILMSLNMLIEFGDAFDYSGKDFGEWSAEVGFNRYEILDLEGACRAAVAYK